VEDVQPFYIVYAGWYAPGGVGRDPEMPEYTIGVWSPCGTQQRQALAKFHTYQQQDYDFVGIEIEFPS